MTELQVLKVVAVVSFALCVTFGFYAWVVSMEVRQLRRKVEKLETERLLNQLLD